MPIYDCPHDGLIMLHKSVTIDPERNEHYTVTLCPKCGLFEVKGNVNGQSYHVTFWLVTEECVRAAGAWLRNAEAYERRPERN